MHQAIFFQFLFVHLLYSHQLLSPFICGEVDIGVDAFSQDHLSHIVNLVNRLIQNATPLLPVYQRILRKFHFRDNRKATAVFWIPCDLLQLLRGSPCFFNHDDRRRRRVLFILMLWGWEQPRRRFELLGHVRLDLRIGRSFG